MSIDYHLIGARIKEKRKSMQYTQEKLSEQLNVSVGYVSQIERGYAKPNLEMLCSISEILNCDITDFLCNIAQKNHFFLQTELQSIFSDMTPAQRKMLLEIAVIIKDKKIGDV